MYNYFPYPKHALMALHRRLVSKGYYYAASDVLAYLRGIHTIFIKASVNYWLTNFRSIGW
jgi:hypothetical protein